MGCFFLNINIILRQTLLPSLLRILPRVKVVVPYTDFKHHINQYILSTWQDYWSGCVANKLHSAKPVLGDGSPTCGAERMKLSCAIPLSPIHTY